MNVTELIHSMAVKARAASAELGKFETSAKNAALLAIADRLEKDSGLIYAANAVDVKNAAANAIAPAMIDRLTLTPERIAGMAQGVREVAELSANLVEMTHDKTNASLAWVDKTGCEVSTATCFAMIS